MILSLGQGGNAWRLCLARGPGYDVLLPFFCSRGLCGVGTPLDEIYGCLIIKWALVT